MKLQKNSFVISSLLLLVMVSGLIAQPPAPTVLDPRRYDAWTIEYEPYRLLVENALEEFIALNDTDLPPISISDMVIGVRSKSGPRNLYQIRYGTQAEGFQVIHNQEAVYILGATLSSTISQKEQYYHQDTQIPFQNYQHNPTVDYLNVASFWTHTDLELGMDRLIYLFGKTGGLAVEMGNELTGRPYATAGYSRFGVITPMFKMGIQIPIGFYPTGYVPFDTPKYDKPLLGGLGAYGAFRYKVVYGELFYQTMEGGFETGPSINYVDLGGLLNLSFTTPVPGIDMGERTLLEGAIMIRLGAIIQRVDHVKYNASEERYQFQSKPRELLRDPGSDIPHYSGATYEDDSGVFVRLDYMSTLVDKTYPKHEAVLQYAGSSLLVKYTHNFNRTFSLPVTYVTYMSDNEWTPTMALLVGVKVRLTQGL